jgi:hypothetical protein
MFPDWKSQISLVASFHSVKEQHHYWKKLNDAGALPRSRFAENNFPEGAYEFAILDRPIPSQFGQAAGYFAGRY